MDILFSILGLAGITILLSIIFVWTTREMKSIGWNNKQSVQSEKDPICNEKLWLHHYNWDNKLTELKTRREAEKRAAELELTKIAEDRALANAALESIKKWSSANDDIKLTMEEATKAAKALGLTFNDEGPKDNEDKPEEPPPGRRIRL